MIPLPKNSKKLFFTADLHLSHENAIYHSKRPYDRTSHMDADLVRRWNKKVKKKDDLVIVVGDLSMNKPLKLPHFVNQLKGRKILVLGNHDTYKPSEYLDMGFESVHTSLYLKYDVDLFVAHDPSLYEVLPSHESFMICGHVHRFFRVHKGCVNCGVDVQNFYPVSYDDLYKQHLESVAYERQKAKDLVDKEKMNA